jgi:Tfp pilus assembly protein PilF
MTFPPEGTSMSASRFRSLRSILFFTAAVLASPITSLTQSDSKGIKSNYVVSVQELRMAGKGHAAFEKGSRLLEKGDPTGSLPYLEKAIAQFPEHYLAYYDLGVAHSRLGHTADAEQAFQKAIDLTKGNFALPQFGLGAILCQKAEFTQAEALLQRAVDLEPGSPVGKYYLGWAQFGLNRLIAAERSLEQALLRNANFAQAYLLLANIHVHQRKLPAAANDLESYLKLDPRNEQARSLAEQLHREMERQTAAMVATAQP